MATPLQSSKERLDRVLVSQGLATSREAAARSILAGVVTVDGVHVDKPAKLISPQANVQIETGAPFVSRGGGKLAAALDCFGINVRGLTCLDVGCSTGGFTDCLLQRGARKVFGVDVGYGQFDWRLRQDCRVVLLERTNIRYLHATALGDPIQLAVIDVSFISLRLVLPNVVIFLHPGAEVVTLIKPQFEVGKGNVGAGGIVRDDAQREGVSKKVIDFAAGLGLDARGRMDCPVQGRKGNREILVWFSYRSKMTDPSDMTSHT
ncbi:MAG TPA: TlyA family RNA methyltransferase [Nitrospira sp.]|nr:TlyA family RNA methyltransferase [Nitrospira sp.]